MTAPGSAYMGASDAFTWRMERDPALRSTVVVVDWLDRPPDWDALVARVDRITRIMPSLRQRVIESPFGLTAPRWSYHPHFDLDWHIGRIAAPAPRTREAILQFARRSAMDAFDRDRPLWELTLAEGIEDGQAALIFKFHHALSDGVGGMRMLAIIAAPQRDPSELGPMPPAPPGETLDRLALAAGTVGSMTTQLTGLARRGAEARCGLQIIDLESGDVVAWVRMEGMVSELYDVAVLPGVMRPMALGFKTREIEQLLTIDTPQSL